MGDERTRAWVLGDIRPAGRAGRVAAGRGRMGVVDDVEECVGYEEENAAARHRARGAVEERRRGAERRERRALEDAKASSEIARKPRLRTRDGWWRNQTGGDYEKSEAFAHAYDMARLG